MMDDSIVEQAEDSFASQFHTDFVTETDLHEHVRLATRCEYPVLITGETGTGKELVARAIHKYGTRRTGPLVSINCALIPKDNLYAELFGVAKGAFTNAKGRGGLIETANKGTLFLDEVGDLPPDAQAGLLRVLETGEVKRLGDTEGTKATQVNVRIVAATNRNVHDEKVMRMDLLHRLRVVPISIGPLRRRVYDIPALLGHLLGDLGIQSVDFHFFAFCMSGEWLGNVRELKNFCQYARLRSDSNHLGNPFTTGAMRFFPYHLAEAEDESEYFLQHPPCDMDAVNKDGVDKPPWFSSWLESREALHYMRFLRLYQTEITKRKNTHSFGIKRVRCQRHYSSLGTKVVAHVYPTITVDDMKNFLSDSFPRSSDRVTQSRRIKTLLHDLAFEVSDTLPFAAVKAGVAKEMADSYQDALKAFEGMYFKAIIARYPGLSNHAIAKIIGVDAKTVKAKRMRYCR